MSFAIFITLLILFVFFAIISMRESKSGSKRFWAGAITISSATAILYLFTKIYMECHPTIFIVLLLLAIGTIVFFVARYYRR